MDVAGLLEALRLDARGQVRADRASRELYASDASLYRRVPVAVLRAAATDDLELAVRACRAHGVPLTMRGAGTSLAGQAVGPGLVLDCGGLADLSIDPDARLATVGPGVVLDALNAAAAAHGLAFGPDVATASRATLGGMIGNNSAGARSVVYGLTADHVEALDVLLADGSRALLRRGSPPPAPLQAAAASGLGEIGRLPTLLRRVSGYNIDALADGDWPRVVVGSEGTLAVVRSATLRLVPRPAARGLGVLVYATVDAALDAVPDLLSHGPSAIELMDRELLAPANRPPAERAMLARLGLGSAAAILLVEMSGAVDEVEARLGLLRGARRVTDDGEQAALWAARRSGIARALRGGAHPDERPVPIIEDPAVPPDRLAPFARAVRAVLEREGLRAVWYGHASVGCLHIRPLMDLRQPGAVARLRRVATDVADLVAAHGGSLSGEHGDGRARGELLPRMYAPDVMDAFRRLKRLMDPDGILNPGVLIDAEPLDAHLRIQATPRPAPRPTRVSFAREGGLAQAAEACNNNGACRGASGVMCPSYQATGDERHSTRGRAALIRAAVAGALDGGLADDGLHEALDLCLGCKACRSECPAQVDMARLKVEALAARAASGRLGVRAHLAGRAHTLLAAGSYAPALAGLLTRAMGAGLGGRRPPTPARRWRPESPTGSGPDVTLVADTFTRHLHPSVGRAAVRVLAACGLRVHVVNPGCCGRPLLSQGLVEPARRTLRRALDRLAPHALAGRPLVFLEPSCWSMLVDDAETLLADDPRVAWIAAASRTFEQHLAGCELPPLRPMEGRAVVHEHCHARALGGDAALGLMERLPGLRPVASGAGCCGMAGAFGYLHPELSRGIAADRLLPALRGADRVVAPGMSCRCQVADLGGVRAMHPAEVIAEAMS